MLSVFYFPPIPSITYDIFQFNTSLVLRQCIFIFYVNGTCGTVIVWSCGKDKEVCQNIKENIIMHIFVKNIEKFDKKLYNITMFFEKESIFDLYGDLKNLINNI